MEMSLTVNENIKEVSGYRRGDSNIHLECIKLEMLIGAFSLLK